MRIWPAQLALACNRLQLYPTNPGRTYYFVFLAGIDKHSRTRAKRHSHLMATLEDILFLFFDLLFLLSFILGAFYVLKSAFDLNILPGFSRGVWNSLQSKVGGM